MKLIPLVIMVILTAVMIHLYADKVATDRLNAYIAVCQPNIGNDLYKQFHCDDFKGAKRVPNGYQIK